MEHNLKNRYIYAVTRHLPIRIQADVERELDSLISEMIDEGDGNNGQRDMEDVLAELGPPEELALKYCGGERKALISGIYFLMYKRVLRTVLPITAVVLAVLTTVGFLMGDEFTSSLFILFVDVTIATHVVQVIVFTVGGVVQAFAVITVVFAVLEYMKVDIKGSGLNNLPEIPDAKHTISPYGPIGGIAFAVSTSVLFLGFPYVMRIGWNFGWVAVFDTGIIRSLWLPIILWTIVEIVAEIMKLVEGRYTMRLAMVTVVTSILQVIFTIIVFGNNGILNPEFISQMGELGVDFEAIGWIYDNIIMQPNMLIMAIVLIVIFFETLDVVVKALQSKRP